VKSRHSDYYTHLFVVVRIAHELDTKLSITISYCNSAVHCIRSRSASSGHV